jgi:CRISPR-associated endonuclease Csn1
MQNKKRILGLDLGTNSIGWALIKQDIESKTGEILGMGSRIIPMSQEILGEFDKGNSVSQTAARTDFRSVRRLRERHLLRRERLHRVLNILGFLPKHYANQIDFENRLGQFVDEKEPKIAWKEIAENKFEFVFKKSFEEMMLDFRKTQPELLNRKNRNGEDAKIPYDWTIYYIRKKALSQKIDKEELAWLMLNFNQKRGYYQLRGEEDEDETRTPQTRIYFDTQLISEITDTGAIYKGLKVINIKLANGDVGKYFSKEIPNWVGIEKNIIATIDLDKNGNDKYEEDGNLRRKFSIPTEEDWEKKWKLIKIKTEKDIKDSGKTVGTYIYDTLLLKPNQKIRGKLVRTIERKFYKEELNAILQKQIELQPRLFSDELYNDCVRELYRNNQAHQSALSKRNFIHLFLEDIIFYQRPLKSQKSSIGNCSLEKRPMKDKNGHLLKDTNGNQVLKPLKAIAKSNPLYQEFRVWQWLFNLKIYRKEDEADVTHDFIADREKDWNKYAADMENLFSFLMTKKEVDHEDIIKHLLQPKKLKSKELKSEIAKYRWNYVYDSVKDESKEYPCNETGYEIRRRLEKVGNVPNTFLTAETEQQLWHIIYSVTDKKQFETTIENFIKRYNKKNQTNIDEVAFIKEFIKFPPFTSEYGSYSEKAIKKLLPLMRVGRYWDWQAIDPETKERINKIITGEYDEEIKNRVREKAIHLTDQEHFQGLQLWLAQYIVYGRHSEAALAGKWKSSSDLEQYLKDFKQHSLRNPIVEQVVTETLRVVKDIWRKYGNGTENFFDEIHIELGREMKNTAEDRKQITEQVSENENTNLRIKALIMELKENSDGTLPVENVRPYSPPQQEALRIYEDGVLNSGIEIPEDIVKISRVAQPSKSELIRYKLWLEQRYRSPYTGEIIPLARLFTEDYQIEHIIPQSRFFDDSFSNKVICEAVVNGYPYKDNQLGLEFIKNHGGRIVDELSGTGKIVKIFTEDEYKDFIKQHYDKNRGKRNKLLLEDIPEKMIERQLNDTRYISKFVSNVLSNVVRANKDDDGVNSKNLIPGNGKITSQLKQDWGLNDVWNDLILPRFERMNQLTNSKDFTAWSENHRKLLPTVPLQLSKGFQKKRIDHRHHALDALVIACATREHINFLNNEHALRKGKSKEEKQKIRYDLRAILCFKKFDKKHPKNYQWVFHKPWNTITENAREALEKVVVTFKQNLRVINKTTNEYESYKDENGNLRIGKDGKPKKEFIPQAKGDSWAIRKSLHKATVSGKVELPRIKVPKDKILTATRKSIGISFDEETIKSITDTGIKKILQNYLTSKGGNADLAFSSEGIEDLNNNIKKYNNGKPHQPIFKVRIFEMGSKFALGENGNKNSKFVEAADGTNLFFAVYENENGERNFETIPLNEVIEHQKWRATLPKEEQRRIPTLPIKIEKGKFLFSLSPNDLVYLPTLEEKENFSRIDFSNLNSSQIKRIWAVNDFSKAIYFRPNRFSKAIGPKEVDLFFNKKKNKLQGSFDYKTASFEGEQIIESCIKMEVDRLGNIIAPYRTTNALYSMNTNESIANEPAITYSGSKKITISSSFEQDENSQLNYWAGLTPEQRFADFYELMSRFYTFVKPDWSTKKIIIDL